MFDENFEKTLEKNETGLPAVNTERKYVYGANRHYFIVASRRAPEELKDMQILFFDDSHNLDISCDKTRLNDEEIISVDDYIINIINYWEKKMVIDLFIEIGKNDPSDFISFMGPLSKKLSSCLQSEKSECPYNNLRAHWTDNRSELKCFKIFRNFWEAFISMQGLMYITTIERKDYDDSYYYVQKYLEGNEEELVTHPNWIKKVDIFMDGLHLLDKFKIKKQINNIEIKTVREELLRMVDVKQQEFNDEIKKKELANFFLTVHEHIVEFAEDYKKNSLLSQNVKIIGGMRYINDWEKIQLTPEFFSKTKQYHNLFVIYMNLVSPFMDLYLLARLFRTYKNPSGGKSAGNMAQRIIIIAGSYHNDIYRKFLFKMGMTIIIDIQEERTRFKLQKKGCLYLKREDLIPFTPIKSVSSTSPQTTENFLTKFFNYFF